MFQFRSTRSKLFITLLINLLVFSAFSQTLTGKVIGITDGDTFKLLVQDSISHKIRVANIDCPEKKQPFSAKATQFTSHAIFGKIVTVKVLSTDRYGRFIGLVTYDTSLNLSAELVKNGFAWHYVKYSNDLTLQELEDKARKNRVGLWQEINATPPWEWRSSKKKKQKL